MQTNENIPIPETQIQKDKMRLTATIYPVFQKKTKPEVRQEASANLYRIFKKYADV